MPRSTARPFLLAAATFVVALLPAFGDDVLLQPNFVIGPPPPGPVTFNFTGICADCPGNATASFVTDGPIHPEANFASGTFTYTSGWFHFVDTNSNLQLLLESFFTPGNPQIGTLPVQIAGIANVDSTPGPGKEGYPDNERPDGSYAYRFLSNTNPSGESADPGAWHLYITDALDDTGNGGNWTTASAVPEPSSWMMMLSGAAAAALLYTRKRRSR